MSTSLDREARALACFAREASIAMGAPQDSELFQIACELCDGANIDPDRHRQALDKIRPHAGSGDRGDSTAWMCLGGTPADTLLNAKPAIATPIVAAPGDRLLTGLFNDLNRVDRDLRVALQTLVDELLARALERIGRTATRAAPARIAATMKTLPPGETLKHLTVEDRNAVLAALPDNLQTIVDRVLEGFEDRTRRIIDGGADSTRNVLQRRLEQEWTPNLRIDDAIAFLRAALVATITRRITGRDGIADASRGEQAGDTMPASWIADTLAIAAGAIGEQLPNADGDFPTRPPRNDVGEWTHEGGRTTSGAFATGPATFDSLDQAADGGSFGDIIAETAREERWVVEEEWVQTHPIPFEPHLERHGMRWTSPAERREILAKDANEFPAGNIFYFAGDHEGCQCRVDIHVRTSEPV